VAYRIGLTGGIGSGKSTVASMFKRRGVPVIDADQVARAVVAPGSDVLSQIESHFGESILREGQLDRRRLREIIFQMRRQGVGSRISCIPTSRLKCSIKLISRLILT